MPSPCTRRVHTTHHCYAWPIFEEYVHVEEMPSTLLADYRTPTYNQDSIPEELTQSHVNEGGSWSMVHVLEGAIELYCEDKLPGVPQRLARRNPGIIEPGERHRLELCGPVRFYIQFFKDPNTD